MNIEPIESSDHWAIEFRIVRSVNLVNFWSASGFDFGDFQGIILLFPGGASGEDVPAVAGSVMLV
jgi:hypothetical protein